MPCLSSSSSYCEKTGFNDLIQDKFPHRSHLQPLDIDRENSDEECMDKEPVGDKHDDGESAKLADCAGREECDDTKNSVVRAQFE